MDSALELGKDQKASARVHTLKSRTAEGNRTLGAYDVLLLMEGGERYVSVLLKQ